jgi:hypothetical protein
MVGWGAVIGRAPIELLVLGFGWWLCKLRRRRLRAKERKEGKEAAFIWKHSTVCVDKL